MECINLFAGAGRRVIAPEREAFYRAALDARTTLNAFHAFDAPIPLRSRHRNRMGRTALAAEATERAFVDLDVNVTAGVRIVSRLRDRIHSAG